MRPFTGFGLSLACILLLGPAFSAEPRGELMIVHAGWLLEVPGKAPKVRQTLVIEGGRIREVRPGYLQAGNYPRNVAVRVENLEKQFVTPGLIDCHVHLTLELGPMDRLNRVEREDSDVALLAADAARRTIEAGFTTVRDLGARGHAIFALRNAINAGVVPGPRILAAGAMISATGGHGDEGGYRESVLDVLTSDDAVCDGADACRKMVRTQSKRGADVIKFAATGGVLSISDKGVERQFTDPEMEAIVTTAHELGLKVAAHAHDKGGINAALRAGVDSIEHGTFADDGSFELLRQTGAYVVPTQMTIGVAERVADDPLEPSVVRAKARAILPQMKQALPQMVKAGVKLAFGTDAGTYRHGDNAQEFGYLTKAGITPIDAIKMATTNAAELLGLSREIGTLEPGKWADLIALDHDPTRDTSAFEHPTFVMRSGVVYRDVRNPRSPPCEGKSASLSRKFGRPSELGSGF